MNVYGSMDRQALDAAYNNSAAVADSDRYLADWLRRSEALRVRMPAEGPLAHGFHVAIAGYTLAPEATMDSIVGEARTALHWLH